MSDITAGPALFDLLGGNDTLHIDLNGGNPTPHLRGIRYLGGDGGFDTLSFHDDGTVYNNATYTFHNKVSVPSNLCLCVCVCV